MDLREYTIEHEALVWSMKVQIDFDYVPEGYDNIQALMKELILFWSNGASDLRMFENNISEVFILYLTRQVFALVMENYSTQGILDFFRNAEGWCYSFNGKHGIKIFAIEKYEIDLTEFLIKEK